MNTDLDYIEKRLNSLPKCLAPLKEVSLRYLPRGYRVRDGAIRFGRFRKYDHDHFHITIFPPAEPNWLVCKRPFEPPLDCLQLLSYANGVQLFGITLYGFTPSMQGEFPRLDRSRAQCLDITTANEIWLINFKNRPANSAYIGGRAFSYHENSAYFMDEHGAVTAILKSGQRVGEWRSLWELLPEEIELEERKLRPN